MIGLASALVAAAQDPRARPRPTDAQLRAAADEAFADDLVQQGLVPPPGSTESTLDDFVRALVEVWRGWLEWIDTLRGTSPFVYGFAIIALVAILILLIWHIVYTVRKAWRVTRDFRSEIPDDPVERRRTSKELRGAARAAAEAGRIREAAHLLLLGLTALLEESKTLRVAHSWTPREIVARLAPRLGEEIGEEALQSFRVDVERAVYAAVEPGPHMFEAMDGFYARVQAGVAEGRR